MFDSLLTNDLVIYILAGPVILAICFIVNILLIRPRLGLLLICISSPLDLLQRIPHTSINLAKVFAALTLIGLLIRSRKVKRTKLDFLMLLLILLQIIGIRQIELGVINRVLITISYLFLYLMMVNLVKTRKFLQTLVFTSSIMGFLLSCLAIAQFISGNVLIPINFVTHMESADNYLSIGILNSSTITNTNRAIMTSLNPSSGASLVILLIMPALGFSIGHSSRVVKLLLGIMTVTVGLGILATQSRSGLLGFIFALLCLFYLLGFRFRYLILVVIIICFTISIIFYHIPEIELLLESIVTYQSINDFSVLERIILFRTSIDIIRDYPIFGVGISNYKKFTSSYGRDYGLVDGRPPHNIFLHLAVETGLPSLIIFILLIIRFITMMLKSAKASQDKRLKFLSYGFVSGFIGYLVHAQFHAAFWVNMLWFFVGLGLSCYNIVTKSLPERD